MAPKLKEKCAVAGVITTSSDVQAASEVFNCLRALQHRGPEASGIVSETPEGRLKSFREHGSVGSIYTPAVMKSLVGKVAVGHNRYSTSGSERLHLQPVVDETIGLAFAHNGNLPTTSKLETYLGKHAIRYKNANDSEMMGFALAQLIRDGSELPDAIEKAYPMLTGSFSCVAMHNGMLVAFRDRYGIRPLAIGTINGSHIIASETCGIDAIAGSTYLREVEPGEMVIITKDGMESRQIEKPNPKLDMFEFVYFARPDSQLYGKRVFVVRYRFGEQLAKEHPPLQDNHDNIIVIPVPDTSIPAAEGYANTLGLRHTAAIVKTRDAGRNFLLTNNQQRQAHLFLKHNVIPEVIAGKDVILIDDSIVRLNTMPHIVRLVSRAGAKSITVLIASPPVRFPDFYGIDTPSQKELAAAKLTIEEIKGEIRCQYLGYLSLSGMVRATGIPADKYNLSCFNGEYPIDIGDHKKEIEKPISMVGAD